MKKTSIITPLLFSLYPVLLLYAYNLEELSLAVILFPLLTFFIFGLIFLSLFSLLFRNWEKSALFTSLFILFFSTFGHLTNLLEKTFLSTLTLKFTKPLLGLWLVAFVVVVYLVFKTYVDKKRKLALTRFFFLTSVFLISLPTATIFYKTDLGNLSIKHYLVDKLPIKTDLTASRNDINSFPDIYYIIFDRYAQAASLKKYYGYDNSDFTKFLTDNGFYVAQNSFANYPITDISLASSLNMSYLDELSEKVGKQQTDFGPLHSLLKNHQVGRFLKSQGYTYIHLGSTWGPTSTSDIADINDQYRPPLPLSAFSLKLFEMTALYPLVEEPITILGKQIMKPSSFEEISRSITLYQLDKIPNIAASSPKFVFAHVLLPHEPYVFKKDGSPIPRSEAVVADRKEYYLNQLIYGNRLIKAMVEKLIQQTAGQAVIILQADEGPLPRRYKENEYSFDWQQATVDELREKLGILNAYFLPGIKDMNPRANPESISAANKEKLLYPAISPVNTFRLIFNLYFGADLPMLPDKHFVTANRGHPYNYIEVTDRLKTFGL